MTSGFRLLAVELLSRENWLKDELKLLGMIVLSSWGYVPRECPNKGRIRLKELSWFWR